LFDPSTPIKARHPSAIDDFLLAEITNFGQPMSVPEHART